MLHFIRPYGLLIILPLMVFAWYKLQAKRHYQQWKTVCDEHLLAYLIEQKQLSHFPIFSYIIFGLLFAVAISGPAWRQLPTPVFRQMSTRVIVFSMTPSLYAQDIKPSRLVRARYKLIDLLKQSTEGQTGLIVYNDEPYVVAPLTEDTNTLINLVPVLDPSIIPNARVGASATSASPVIPTSHVIPANAGIYALKQAQNLIQQANQPSGHIIIMTDQDVTEETIKFVEKLHQENINTSVLAFGTEQGAPIPLPQGGFMKDASGQMVLAKLSAANLKKLALAGGGKFQTMDVSNSDVNQLLNLSIDKQKQKSNQQATLWKDEGAWFILAMLPFLYLAFRRDVGGVR